MGPTSWANDAKVSDTVLEVCQILADVQCSSNRAHSAVSEKASRQPKRCFNGF